MFLDPSVKTGRLIMMVHSVIPQLNAKIVLHKYRMFVLEKCRKIN